jgi:hypothetical protein
VTQTIAFGTQHDKARLVSPFFTVIPELTLREVAIDTDQFGTFSGDIPRVLSPYECALQKAKLAAQAAGTRYGLGSEGSIGVHPAMPFITSDVEHLVLWDEQEHVALTESVLGPIATVTGTYSSWDECHTALSGHNFEGNFLICRSPDQSSVVVKGIRSEAELHEAFLACQAESGDQRVTVESDLRAMCSVSRQNNISAVAEKLAARLSRSCPSCEQWGWGLEKNLFGAPCSECGMLSPHALREKVLVCEYCQFEHTQESFAACSPAQCSVCNP